MELRSLLLGVPPSPSLRSDIEASLKQVCKISQTGEQAVAIPSIQLSDCSSVTINAINSLDQTGQCVLGTTGQFLLPPSSPAAVGSSPILTVKRTYVPSTGEWIGIGVAMLFLLVLALILGLVIPVKTRMPTK
jgi:hypothetical protein